MKLGAIISSSAHVALLVWGAYSWDGVRNIEVAQVEALPVDFIPIESITRSIKGDIKAERAENPAPKPTQKPPEVEQAQNIGEAKVDEKSKADAPPKPKPVEAAAPPPQEKIPDPLPLEKPEPAPQSQEKETPVTTNDVAAENEPAVPVEKEIVKEEPAKAEEGEEFAPLPDNVPLPISRPKPPKSNTAKTQDRKKTEEQAKKSKKASAKENENADADAIRKLLNREDAAGSGAKRSKKKKALGSRKSTGAKLSRSEMDALRGAIEQCWNVPIGLSGAEDMRVTITMNLAKDGSVDGKVRVKASGGESRARRAFSESARRAVLKCAPYNLPKDKYDTWSQVIVNFDPSQMF